MNDEFYVYSTAAVIMTVSVLGVFRKSFDPFAPHWLFLAGFTQVYVVQAITYRDYAIRIRGVDLVTAANLQALWALLWFLLIYFSGIGRWIAARFPSPPSGWSTTAVATVSPLLIVWGLICAGIQLSSGGGEEDSISAEAALFRSFPIMMLVGAVLVLVTGRQREQRLGPITLLGLAISTVYIFLWMIRGRRTPPLFGLMATVCAFYITRCKRPSKPILAATALGAALVVSLSLGFRGNKDYEHSFTGFLKFVTDFRVDSVFVNLNLKTNDEELSADKISHETEEYCAYLLMKDTVPEKSDYDYGTSYLRLFSTYIPRIVWRDKPLFGREQWINAWIAGSEYKRSINFTGPAISLLGATQLNGGPTATLIVVGALALLLRSCYEYFKRYQTYPWVQVWWSMTFYNAWLMVVNDDPFVWFYYVYGHTVLPPMALFFLMNKIGAQRVPAIGLASGQGGEFRQTAPV